MNIVAEYVSTLLDQTKITIINDYEQFEKDGMIGECQLRNTTCSFMEKHNIPDSTPVLWMNQVAMECYKYFAARYLHEIYETDTVYFTNTHRTQVTVD